MVNAVESPRAGPEGDSVLKPKNTKKSKRSLPKTPSSHRQAVGASDDENSSPRKMKRKQSKSSLNSSQSSLGSEYAEVLEKDALAMNDEGDYIMCGIIT